MWTELFPQALKLMAHLENQVHQPYAGHDIKFETCAEIIAKKMWHRGNQSKARDLFDLCAVADAEPEAIEKAAPFFGKYGAAFLLGLEKRADFAKAEFDAIDGIDAMGPQRSFAKYLDQARGIIRPMIGHSG